MRVTCPTRVHLRPPLQGPLYVVGCGKTFESTPDEEGLHDCPNCGMFFRLEPNGPLPRARTPFVCVGTKRGDNYGLVYRPNGAIIGRVKRDSKDAAGTYVNGYPSKRTFYTAELLLGDARLAVPSLGTRHATRADAANAVRLFWDWFALNHRRAIPTSFDVQAFKFEHRKVCALDASPMVRVQHPSAFLPTARVA